MVVLSMTLPARANRITNLIVASTFSLAYPSRRYHSAWIGMTVHSTQTVVIRPRSSPWRWAEYQLVSPACWQVPRQETARSRPWVSHPA